MEKVEYRKSGGKVSVRITIQTVMSWEYEYVPKAPPPFASDSTKPVPFPHAYSLGNPPSLHRDIHGFEAEVYNPSQADQGCSISFEWIQEDPAHPGSEKILHDKKNEGAVVEPGGTLTFGGSVKFVEIP